MLFKVTKETTAHFHILLSLIKVGATAKKEGLISHLHTSAMANLAVL